jgi:subtilisin family serine protease
LAVNKKNIFLNNTAESIHYGQKGHPVTTNYPMRSDKCKHANFISKQLKTAMNQSYTQKQVAAIRYKEGTYLEFVGQTGCDLASKSLENLPNGIRLLNIRCENEIIKATVYVPKGKELFFISKIDKYANELTKSGNPKYNDVVSSIENIKLALVDAFWIGSKDDIPGRSKKWCEVWLRYNPDSPDESKEVVTENFKDCCHDLSIELNPKEIIFPERLVKLVRVNKELLKKMISMNTFIAEFRRAPESTSFFDTQTNVEQKKWAEELLSRTKINNTNGITVCILDTGINDKHPLLRDGIQNDGVHTVQSEWGTEDDTGHGTEMAGIAMYSDLKDKLLQNENIVISHTIESVKILPNKGENSVDLYGAITEQAVYLAQITNPQAKRTICMAVTSNQYNTTDGSPTSWSAAIDTITSGVENNHSKQLFIISAGNVTNEELTDGKYPNANCLHGVENPGQAWNALTVGAIAKNGLFDDSDSQGFSVVTTGGGISPYSATSITWNRKWPIKPEIVMDGGNMVTNGYDFCSCSELSLLTTFYRPSERIFTTTWGTSPASAEASWMAAQLFNEYPEAWPETIRALMVHSAKWTSEMIRQFCPNNSSKSERGKLLRACGYGVPDLNQAIQCFNNSVNMIIQDELQPYTKKSMNEMHFHNIPWPKDVLESLGEIEVEMRVTLSYFIEPGPGEIGWKDKYRYPSCGLRFDVKIQNESIDEFKKRINSILREKKVEMDSGSERWYLGKNNRDVGSIHSDIWRGNAVDLSEANYIAVFPVTGWWHERSYLNKYNNRIRYSLVISIATPQSEVDLYTPIIVQIPTSISIPV